MAAFLCLGIATLLLLSTSPMTGTHASSASVVTVGWPKVVLFGDTFVQSAFSVEGGWGSVLADNLQRRADVVVRGFDGYTSRMAKALLPWVFPSLGQPVTGVVVMLGTYDAIHNWLRDPIKKVTLKEYKNNLVSIIGYLESQGVNRSQIILVSPPPAFVAFRRGEAAGEYHKWVKTYAEVCDRVAKKLDMPSVDLFGQILEKNNWRIYLGPNGVSLSYKGSMLLVETLWPVLKEITARLDNIFPTAKMLRAVDPGSTIEQWIATQG